MTTITVSGSATVGGTAYPATAQVSLQAASSAQCLFGIWDDGSAWPSTSYAGVQKFSAAPVKSATQYLAWLGPFPAAFNTLCAAAGSTMYLNLEPWNTWGGGASPTIPDIAAGKYDSYLTTIGQAIKAGGVTVNVTWAHEMNGTWYPWGIESVTPAQWIAGWQHVYTTIKAAAGSLASMVWCPNNNDVGPVTPYWPGQAYVDLAAFDGYLNTTNASQTFASFVEPTVAEIRKLTSGPVWNAETGVQGTNREARLTQFAQDMKSGGIAGFTWFNEGDYLLDTSETAALCAAVNAWNAG